MTPFKNFKMVDYVVFGNGALNQLDAILSPHRKGPTAPMVFLLDSYFQDKTALLHRLPLQSNDEIMFVNVREEPKTKDIDQMRDKLQQTYDGISGIIGIGGGSVLDTAKAVSLMLTNPGSSAEYQGWDLVKNPGIYKVAIPTISGTGAEVSRTAVLTGPLRKLGLNSDFTPFNQIVLDPQLIASVPHDQRFYTGMDCYIHCIESLEGSYLNAFSRAYGEKALALCEEVFLHKDHWNTDSDEKLMMASYAGGMSIAYSQVGVAHAVSYGLSYVLGTKHGIGNCIVFDALEEFYPKGVSVFKEMLKKNHIVLPKGITQDLTEAQMQQMINISLSLAPLWENALGLNWKTEMPPERLYALYKSL